MLPDFRLIIVLILALALLASVHSPVGSEEQSVHISGSFLSEYESPFADDSELACARPKEPQVPLIPF